MKIRIWNAFASNNSGSYTLVGSFPSPAEASAVAAELSALMRAHTDWREHDRGQVEPQSPLRAFVSKHGLHGETHYEWPEHGEDNAPRVFGIDHQVLIHHEYTLSLPPVFGEFFYARGGRVEHELDHAHHPLVAVFDFWLKASWEERRGGGLASKVTALTEALQSEGGPLAPREGSPYPPVWQTSDDGFEADLRVGAVFKDLLEGFTAVAQAAEGHGFGVQVKVLEAWEEEGDPLAFLRKRA